MPRSSGVSYSRPRDKRHCVPTGCLRVERLLACTKCLGSSPRESRQRTPQSPISPKPRLGSWQIDFTSEGDSDHKATASRLSTTPKNAFVSAEFESVIRQCRARRTSFRHVFSVPPSESRLDEGQDGDSSPYNRAPARRLPLLRLRLGGGDDSGPRHNGCCS
jgi:hypothetical protein